MGILPFSRKFLLKFALASPLAFLLPAAITAQQPATPLSSAAAEPLPDAPLPQTASVDAAEAPLPADDTLQTQTSSSSQQTQRTPAAQQPQTQDQSTQAEQQLKKQESQRMLGIVPAFNEVIGGKAVPLTPRQKFSLFFHSSIDPYQFAVAGIDAGIEQAENSYPEWHQGAEGYGKRYAAAFADNFDGNFWGNAVLPSLLHQDPRYFRLGHGKVLHRILYAAATTVICKGDDGNWQFNVSNLSGNFIGGAISNAYYPASDRGAVLTIDRALTTSAEGAIGALAEEFYPDFATWWHNRHARKAARTGA